MANIINAVQQGAMDTYSTIDKFKDGFVNPKYADLGKNLKNLEKNYLNPWGKVPVFSFISGYARSRLGEVMLTLSLASAFFRGISAGVFGINTEKGAKLWAQVKIDFEFTQHAFSNMVRGYLEMISALNILGIIVLKPALIQYDLCKRLQYPIAKEIDERLKNVELQENGDLYSNMKVMLGDLFECFKNFSINKVEKDSCDDPSSSKMVSNNDSESSLEQQQEGHITINSRLD